MPILLNDFQRHFHSIFIICIWNTLSLLTLLFLVLRHSIYFSTVAIHYQIVSGRLLWMNLNDYTPRMDSGNDLDDST